MFGFKPMSHIQTLRVIVMAPIAFALFVAAMFTVTTAPASTRIETKSRSAPQSQQTSDDLSESPPNSLRQRRDESGEQASPRSTGGRWPAIYNLPTYFYSTDLSVIELTVRHFHDADPTHRVLLRIPRAYLILLDRYDATRVSSVPDTAEAQRFNVAFTYPDGKPLSVHARELAAEAKISEPAALRKLRPVSYDARISYARPSLSAESDVPGSVREVPASGEYDGLAIVEVGRRQFYLGRPGIDEFVLLSCSPQREARPGYLCEARLRLGRNLQANVQFSDFRFQGGARFANERARVFRETVCKFVIPACSG